MEKITHDPNHDLTCYFSQVPYCTWQKIRSVFRILGMCNFGQTSRFLPTADWHTGALDEQITSKTDVRDRHRKINWSQCQSRSSAVGILHPLWCITTILAWQSLMGKEFKNTTQPRSIQKFQSNVKEPLWFWRKKITRGTYLTKSCIGMYTNNVFD